MTLALLAQFWIASFSVDPPTWASFARCLEAVGLLVMGDDPREELATAYAITGGFLAFCLAALLWTWSAVPRLQWMGARRGLAS